MPSDSAIHVNWRWNTTGHLLPHLYSPPELHHGYPRQILRGNDFRVVQKCVKVAYHTCGDESPSLDPAMTSDKRVSGGEN
jgi:hypothetical protein